MLNRVILIGRLATDPELKYTPSGIAVANFVLAVDRYTKDAEGKKEADFIPIVVWKQSAEFAANYLTKGRMVAVDGRLQIRSWVAQDGTRRKNAEVVAENLKSLDKPKETSAAPAIGEEPAPADARPGPDLGSDELDDPFADE